MKENQAFIFFIVRNNPTWVQYQDILHLFMNRIVINEDDQSEIVSIEDLKSWKAYGLSQMNKKAVKMAFKPGFPNDEIIIFQTNHIFNFILNDYTVGGHD